jgi:hypothetical protein
MRRGSAPSRPPAAPAPAPLPLYNATEVADTRDLPRRVLETFPQLLQHCVSKYLRTCGDTAQQIAAVCGGHDDEQDIYSLTPFYKLEPENCVKFQRPDGQFRKCAELSTAHELINVNRAVWDTGTLTFKGILSFGHPSAIDVEAPDGSRTSWTEDPDCPRVQSEPVQSLTREQSRFQTLAKRAYFGLVKFRDEIAPTWRRRPMRVWDEAQKAMSHIHELENVWRSTSAEERKRGGYPDRVNQITPVPWAYLMGGQSYLWHWMKQLGPTSPSPDSGDAVVAQIAEAQEQHAANQREGRGEGGDRARQIQDIEARNTELARARAAAQSPRVNHWLKEVALEPDLVRGTKMGMLRDQRRVTSAENCAMILSASPSQTDGRNLYAQYNQQRQECVIKTSNPGRDPMSHCKWRRPL